MLPTFAVIIEWDNARISEVGRAREMLRQLRAQIAGLEPAPAARPDIIILYDRHEVEDGLVEKVVSDCATPEEWPATVRILPTDGLGYYKQKNFGAAQVRDEVEVIVFLDSDVVPEDGWLASLLNSFADPAVAVVGGNTYITLDNLYSKAFALFWFFPLREEGTGLRQSPRFFANNVAFRREVFASHPFPELPSFRGQCIALADALARDGIKIHLRLDARVSHPAPNGGRHFVARALCEGHDERIIQAERGAGLAASPVGTCGRYGRDLARAAARTLRYGRRARLNPVTAVGALAIAGSYCTLKFAGELIAWVQPDLIRKRTAI
jgi:hypothetical protein